MAISMHAVTLVGNQNLGSPFGKCHDLLFYSVKRL
jgi:hypothetical protein